MLVLALFVFPLFLWSCLFTEPLALKDIFFEVELLAKSLLKFNITNNMCIFSAQGKFRPHFFFTNEILFKVEWLAKVSSNSLLHMHFFLRKKYFTPIFSPQTFLPKPKREGKSKNAPNKVSYGKGLNFKNPATSTSFWCWHFGTKVSTPLFKETFQLGSTQYIKVFNFRRY